MKDIFLNMTTWDSRVFEEDCRKHGIVEEDEFFHETASRLWDAYTEDEKENFETNYTNWMKSK